MGLRSFANGNTVDVPRALSPVYLYLDAGPGSCILFVVTMVRAFRVNMYRLFWCSESCPLDLWNVSHPSGIPRDFSPSRSR